MKNILLTLMVFGSFGVFADEENPLYKLFKEQVDAGTLKKPINLQGEMSCKVKDSILIEVEDGKSKRYSGAKDSFNVGDTLYVSYRYEEYFNRPAYVMNFSFEDRLREDTHLYVSENSSLPSSVTSLTFSEEKIFVKDILQRNLSLRRYYKNDWEGIFSFAYGPEFYTWTVTLDCRNQEGRLEEILKAYENRPEKIDL